MKNFKPTFNEGFALFILIMLFVYFFIGLLIWVNGEMLSKRIVLTQNNYQDHISVEAFNLFPRRLTSITFVLKYTGNEKEINNEAREFMRKFRVKPFIDFNIQYPAEQDHFKLALNNLTRAEMEKIDTFIEYGYLIKASKRHNWGDPVNVGFVSYEINLDSEILVKLLQYYNLTIEADFVCPSETLTGVYFLFSALYFPYGIPVIPLFCLFLIIVSIPIFCLILKIIKRSNHVKSHTI